MSACLSLPGCGDPPPAERVADLFRLRIYSGWVGIKEGCFSYPYKLMEKGIMDTEQRRLLSPWEKL